MNQKFKDWDLLDSLPLGWKIDKTVGSPLCGYEFCTNGKSILTGGQKRALVKVINKNTPEIEILEPVKHKIEVLEAKKEVKDENYVFPNKVINDLARKKFQEQILKEIKFDLMACEIEGWDKTEYITELQDLLNSIEFTKNQKTSQMNQLTHIHLDFETYSSVDLAKSGVYAYTEAPDFEILLCSFSIDDAPVKVADFHANGVYYTLKEAFSNPEKYIFHAHNANFERQCLKAIGYDIPVDRFECSMVKCAYAGLPLGLDQVAKALNLDNKKDSKGRELIRFFTMPCKPTKANGMKTRNMPADYPEKYKQFAEYCRQDTVVEMELSKKLDSFVIPAFERDMWVLDQKINDKGVRADLRLTCNAIEIADDFVHNRKKRSTELTGLGNANSVPQLKKWVEEKIGEELEKLDKKQVSELLDNSDCGDEVREVLENRQALGKTSIKKYQAIVNAINDDGRVRGLFQHYGANRTGRWAGRIVQLQNLPRNKFGGLNLDLARNAVYNNAPDLLELMFKESIPNILSQLIRTAFIPADDHTFVISDFSAIEARVTAWLAGEQWRLDVFNSHGKIYEASASRMFHIPIEEITKGSVYRDKGKVAELALGYQGGVGALIQMGGADMGLSEAEMKNIVTVWRKASPNIVKMWSDIEDAAINSVANKTTSKTHGLSFIWLKDSNALAIELPSGRRLHYQSAEVRDGKFGSQLIYKGLGATKTWGTVETYGGKLTENIVQAIARDLLVNAMLLADRSGESIVMHVHDEMIIEANSGRADEVLSKLEKIMSQRPEWAKDIPLKGDGFITNYYKKD